MAAALSATYDAGPTTSRPGFDLAAYAQDAQSIEEPTVVIPSALLLALRAAAAREDNRHSNIEVVELNPDDVYLVDDEPSYGVAPSGTRRVEPAPLEYEIDVAFACLAG